MTDLPKLEIRSRKKYPPVVLQMLNAEIRELNKKDIGQKGWTQLAAKYGLQYFQLWRYRNKLKAHDKEVRQKFDRRNKKNSKIAKRKFRESQKNSRQANV